MTRERTFARGCWGWTKMKSKTNSVGLWVTVAMFT